MIKIAIDFTRYQPPGVYTESVGGPQLSVGSSVPTAVALFGLSQGYRTYRESLVVRPDTKNESNEFVPAANAQLAKSGIKTVEHAVASLSASNVNIVTPGVSIGGVTLTAGDYVRLYGQTNASENGLYRWSDAATPLTPIVDSFKVVNPTTGHVYVNGKDYTLFRIGVGEDTLPATRDDVYTIKRVRGGSSALSEGDVVQISYRYTDPNYFEVYSLYDYDDVRDFYGEPFDANGNIVSELTLAAKFAFLNGPRTY